jgi:hypothetical protein
LEFFWQYKEETERLMFGEVKLFGQQRAFMSFSSPVFVKRVNDRLMGKLPEATPPTDVTNGNMKRMECSE